MLEDSDTFMFCVLEVNIQTCKYKYKCICNSVGDLRSFEWYFTVYIIAYAEFSDNGNYIWLFIIQDHSSLIQSVHLLSMPFWQ